MAWIVIGLGMGAGRYDAAFATLGQIYRDKAGQREISEVVDKNM